jgi:hypothetical protein
MALYYHHVGQAGANEDFPKTVYSKKPVTLVEEAISDEHPYKEQLLKQLTINFPSGDFNCWGVPVGAAFVIKNLSAGDNVLLVESVALPGFIPVLCSVKLYYNKDFSSLSKALWGASKFPYIFFFDTQQIDFTWEEFIVEMGYSGRYNPRGQFLRVRDIALNKYGGANGYVKYIWKRYGLRNQITNALAIIDEELANESEDHRGEVKEQFTEIKEQSLSKTPELEGKGDKQTISMKLTPRDEAFRLGIRMLYDNSCAVCSSRLLTPDGKAEVESAHIYPKSCNGSDDLRNGISLCRIHHWAYDCGWFSIADNFTILVRGDLPIESSYDFIRKYNGQSIHLPVDLTYKPHKLFLQKHRSIFGFE